MINRSTMNYRSRRDPQHALRVRLRELAASRVRFGYRRLTVMLRCEGWLGPVLYWPVLGRAFDWHDGEFWSAEVLALGNPVICWSLNGAEGALTATACLSRARQNLADAQGAHRLCYLAILLLGRCLPDLLRTTGASVV